MKVKMKKAQAALIFLKRNKGTVFAIASAAGVIVTAALSANAGMKAEGVLAEANIVIREHKEDGTYEDKDKYTKAQKAAMLIPVILPPVIAAGGTIALIFLGDASNRKTQAALASAYTLAAKKLTEYKETVKDIYGEDGLKQVVQTAAERQRETVEDWKVDLCANEPGPDDQLYYDEFSQRYFWSTPEKVSDAEYFLNRLFILRGYASLNDFYRLLNIEELAGGDILGWDCYIGEVDYGYAWVDFEHWTKDGDDEDTPPCTTIYFPFEPTPFGEEADDVNYGRISVTV